MVESETFFPEDHYIRYAKELQQEKFTDGYMLNPNVNIYWGVQGLNRENVDLWDPEDLGEVILDN